MNLKPGDKVRFLNDVGGGVIKKIIDTKTVMVLIDEGFDMPVLASEVIKIEEASNTKLDSKNIAKIDIVTQEIKKDSSVNEVNPETISKDDDIRIHFSLVNAKKDSKEPITFDAHLINDCNYKLLYNISLKKSKYKLKTIKYGFLEANNKKLIDEFSLLELSKEPEFVFQLVLFKETDYVFHEPCYRELNIKPIELNDGRIFQRTAFFQEKAALYSLIESKFKEDILKVSPEVIYKISKDKDAASEPIQQKKLKPEIREVDLHIHEVVENEVGMTPLQMIEKQLEKFRLELKKAMLAKEKKIVFIHGKGNGRLKLEISRLLDSEFKSTCSYQDASFQEYGFGATMVIIK